MSDGFLFDFPKFKINKKIRLIELFGGIGIIFNSYRGKKNEIV